MYELSILIPSRNEMFLSKTIEDILEHIESDTEIIAVLDGNWADPPIEQHPRVTLLYYPESIGQRAATNRAAAIATGKYIMKVDAHCAFDQGFDRKMLSVIQPDWTMVPVMRNLHAFDWVCPNGHRRYQGPSGPCTECGEPTERDIVWIAKTNPQSTSYCFDSEPHFQYFNEYRKRQEYIMPLTETMSLQGSCFMLDRKRYFELNMNDENWGSWGSQGIEIAVKTWLSGGKCIVNHYTWYAHMFRTQGGDFSFPYPLGGKQVGHAKKMARREFYEGKWNDASKPLSWLVEKFWPVKGWTDQDLEALKSAEAKRGITHKPKREITKGIVYYTDNELEPEIMQACQQQLLKASGEIPIASVSLSPIEFGKNIVITRERGYLAMFEQILAGLEALDSEIVFFCEHDVLYHPSHFDFSLTENGIYYYNTNVWKLRFEDGHALYTDNCRQTSGLCARRDLLIQHYKERVKRTTEKFNQLGNTREYRNWIRAQGFEPGTHGRPERVDNLKADSWRSQYPIVDVRHEKNLTPSRWRKDQFRNQRYISGWVESDTIPGWGKGSEIFRSKPWQQ